MVTADVGGGFFCCRDTQQVRQGQSELNRCMHVCSNSWRRVGMGFATVQAKAVN